MLLDFMVIMKNPDPISSFFLIYLGQAEFNMTTGKIFIYIKMVITMSIVL